MSGRSRARHAATGVSTNACTTAAIRWPSRTSGDGIQFRPRPTNATTCCCSQAEGTPGRAIQRHGPARRRAGREHRCLPRFVVYAYPEYTFGPS